MTVYNMVYRAFILLPLLFYKYFCRIPYSSIIPLCAVAFVYMYGIHHTHVVVFIFCVVF